MNYKNYIKMSWMLMFTVFASCVDEYNEIPGGYTDPMLVVDGNIYSEQECVFALYKTIPLDGRYLDAIDGVVGATVSVCGNNGQRWDCTHCQAGRYYVPVGTLTADVEYWVEVSAPGYGNYKSTPMKPLFAPELVELTSQCPPEGEEGEVYFLVSTSDMSTGVAHEKSYVMWRYEECYSVNTPVRANYCYDPTSDAIVPLVTPLYHGWKETKPTERIILSNENFDYGAITNYCVYHKSNQDYRFMERYRTCVYQEAITAEEYEYRHLLETQTSEMGGLFTPMPTELPSNVFGVDGEKAIGFVGVRGSVSQKVIYVNRTEAGYHYYPDYKTYQTDRSLLNMYKNGYRISYYNPYQGDVEWASRWVVDVTDGYWGASLEAPDYWEEAEE